MNKGLFITLLYYLIGFGLAGLSYLIFGHPYVHAPGLHHIIIFLTLLIGLVWMLVAFIQFLRGKRKARSKGIMLTHFIIILSFVLFLFYVI